MLPSLYTHAAAAVLSAALAASVAGYAVHQWQSLNCQATLDDWRLAAADLQITAVTTYADKLKDSHAETLRLQAQADTAAREHATRQTAMADALRRTRTERDSLRDDLTAAATGADSRTMPGESCTAHREHAAAVGELLGQCADRLSDMAGKAQGHASDSVMLLEAWPVTLKVTHKLE